MSFKIRKNIVLVISGAVVGLDVWLTTGYNFFPEWQNGVLRTAAEAVLYFLTGYLVTIIGVLLAAVATGFIFGIDPNGEKRQDADPGLIVAASAITIGLVALAHIAGVILIPL